MRFIKYIFLIFLMIFIITATIVHILSKNAEYKSTTVMNFCITTTEEIYEKTKCSYKSLKGSKHIRTFKAIPNQEIVIDYSLEVKKGSLKLSVIDKDKNVIWQEVTDSNKSNKINLVPREENTYKLILTTEGTEGGYSFKWAKEAISK